MIYFTSSWDDGSEYDIKLSEILLKNNQKGTFFIPLANSKKYDVITPKNILKISKDFEIGAHTLNHRYLTSLSNEEAEYEIKQSKVELEKIICRPINGFCFPGGKYKAVHVRYADQAGFKYFRTITMFKLNYCPKIMNTTLQAYDHSKFTYFMHLLKRGYLREFFKFSIPILTNNHWDKLLLNILDNLCHKDSYHKGIVIHLWGHSWEIQENKNWRQLEHFFEHLNNYDIVSKTNFEISQLELV